MSVLQAERPSDSSGLFTLREVQALMSVGTHGKIQKDGWKMFLINDVNSLGTAKVSSKDVLQNPTCVSFCPLLTLLGVKRVYCNAAEQVSSYRFVSIRIDRSRANLLIYVRRAGLSFLLPAVLTDYWLPVCVFNMPPTRPPLFYMSLPVSFHPLYLFWICCPPYSILSTVQCFCI